jgi:hypothetical protein
MREPDLLTHAVAYNPDSARVKSSSRHSTVTRFQNVPTITRAFPPRAAKLLKPDFHHDSQSR